MAFSAPFTDAATSYSLVSAIHLGTHTYPHLRMQRDYDSATVQPADFESPYPVTGLTVRSKRSHIWKPSHPARSTVYEAARRRQYNEPSVTASAEQLTWSEEEVDVPDVSDVYTLSTLAKMSSNAYSMPKEGGWYDLNNNTHGQPFNLSDSFGWEEDGIRGHVFSSGPTNESIIIAIKGTSGFSGGVGAPTGRKDKVNDNLLFSCCCARVDWTWSPVCDCFTGQPNRCNLTCLEDALIEKSVYYPTATDLFNNITAKFPTSKIWLTGHSLGGSIAGLLGVTFGIPTVTFEAPGDLLPAKRLHLPLPPGKDWGSDRPDFGITHVYTNSDPIPQGACTGPLSSCALVGFALESRCHTGQTIVYDAVGKLGWSVDIRTHRIGVIIDQLLIPDWDKEKEAMTVHGSSKKHISTYKWKWPWGRRQPADESGRGDPPTDGDGAPAPTSSPAPLPHKPKSHVPKPEIDEQCIDCFKWEFFDDDGTGNSTSAGLSTLEAEAFRRRVRRKCL